MLLATGGALLSPLSAADNGPISATGTGSVTAGPATVTASGGVAPYTYATAYLSGDVPSAILGGTTSAPSVRVDGMVALEFYGGTIRVTVTDALGATATTDISWTITGG